MTPVAVIASAALSALGRGAAATFVGAAGEAPRSGLRLVPSRGLGLAHPLLGYVPSASDSSDTSDRATALLVEVAAALAAALDSRWPDWRRSKLRILVGTSSGPMNAALAAFAVRAEGRALAGDLARQVPYFAPLASLEAALGLSSLRPSAENPSGTDRAEQILGACASATLAIGLGCRSLDADDVELVIAGGYDALSPFVTSGFEALGALTHSTPNPFRAERDGMALGEGAALLALVRADSARARGLPPSGHVLGFGTSSDAVHLTAPDREGSGVLHAANRALEDAGLDPDAIDLVSAHATSTAYNDAAEARALAQLFPGRRLPVHAFKAQIGHTLGAAGALETLAALDALERGLLPASAGHGALEHEDELELARVNTPRPLRAVLKLSSAFGGLNAALLLASKPLAGRNPPRALRPVFLRAESSLRRGGDPELVARLATANPQLAARADELGALVLAAVADLVQVLGRPLAPRTAVIVATQSATLEQNERFESRRREGRPVEPRRFPQTSPSACAGLCSIVFGLKGPSFSLGSGPSAGREAWRVARDLVRASDVDEAVVVAVEDAGPVVADVFFAAGLATPPRGAAALLLSAEPYGPALDELRSSPVVLDSAGWPPNARTGP
jgi:3-oxoacyl-[acyl-carrier-protein] synthase-1/3-oxoacyl-[acyl-carrier-protein] synthase II